MIMSGVVEITLVREEKRQLLDLLTRGSILGFNGILSQDPWNYEATIASLETAQVIEIPSSLIKMYALIYPPLSEDIEEVSKMLEMTGRPQIDYIIDRTPLLKEEIEFICQDFKTNREWKNGVRNPEREVGDIYGIVKWFDDLENTKAKTYDVRKRTLNKLQRACKRLARISFFYSAHGIEFGIFDLDLN